MEQKVDLVKEVYGRATYPRVVDVSFSELYNPITPVTVTQQVTVEEFFDLYNQLFFEIPATGEVNSHEYLVRRSSELVNFEANTEEIQPLLDEIAQLREQLLQANQQILDLETTTT